MLRILAIVVASFVSLTLPAMAEKRVALVIGNAGYPGVARLANPERDADAIAKAFADAGFDTVDLKTNLTRADMSRVLEAYEEKARGADIAVVFFSGHGLEVGGVNYLIPIDAKLVSERDVAHESISLDEVLAATEGAGRLKLVLIDACRENPFANAMRRATKGTRPKGLGRMEIATTNTLVAYATSPGKIAFDGDGQTSPFTSALIKHLVAPGADVRIALGSIRDDVIEATKGSGEAQQPYWTGSLGKGLITLNAKTAASEVEKPIKIENTDQSKNLSDSAKSLSVAENEQLARAGFDEYLLAPLAAKAFDANVRNEASRRLGVVAAEKKALAAAGNDLDKLKALAVRPCEACTERAQIEARVADAQRRLEQKEQSDLDRAGFVESALTSLSSTALTYRIRIEALRRLSVMEREHRAYLDAVNNVDRLRAFIGATCEACTDLPAARRQLAEIDAQRHDVDERAALLVKQEREDAIALDRAGFDEPVLARLLQSARAPVVVTEVQRRLNLLASERRDLEAAGDDHDKLQAFANQTCEACVSRTRAQDRLRTLPSPQVPTQAVATCKVGGFTTDADRWLALRRTPDSSSLANLLEQLPEYSQVRVISRNGLWWNVESATGKTGWASSRFINCNNAEATLNPRPAVATTEGRCYIVRGFDASTAPNLRWLALRTTAYADPSLANVIDQIWEFSKVRVTGIDGNWYKVENWRGKSGWSHSRYLQPC